MTNVNATKIAKSGLWLMVSFVIGKLSQLVAQIILARLLSPQDFGIWGMVLVVTTLSALFKDTAIAGVLVYKGLEDKKLANAVYSLGINISICMFLLQSMIAFPLSQFFREPLVFPLTICAALIFLISAGTGSHASVLQRQMKFRAVAISDCLGEVTRFTIAISGAVLGWGVWSFVAGEIVTITMDALLKRSLSRYSFTYHLIPDTAAVREVRGYISSLVGINLAVYVNTNIDNLIVGRLIGAQALGFYNMGYQLAMLPSFALSQINRVNFSVLSQKDDEDKRVYISQVLQLYALVYAPIYGVAFVIAPWVIPLVYGAQWTASANIFQIVLIFAYTRGFMSILGNGLNALNKPHINAAINWVLVPVSICGFLIGAWLGGVQGVAYATALVMGVAASVWFWIAICRSAGWKLKDLLQPVLLPTVAVILSVITVIISPLPEYLRPYFQAILVILLYGINISFFSGGEIPKLLIKLVTKALKKNTSVKSNI